MACPPRGHGEYLEHLPGEQVPARIAISNAIAKLMAPGAYPNDPSLFDNRVSRETVRAWRRGTRAVPQWALDLIRAKLEARSAPLVHAAELARNAKAGAGRWPNKLPRD